MFLFVCRAELSPIWLTVEVSSAFTNSRFEMGPARSISAAFDFGIGVPSSLIESSRLEVRSEMSEPIG